MNNTQPSSAPAPESHTAERMMTIEQKRGHAFAGAAARGLRVVGARITTDPSVWFSEDTTTIDEVLDIANAMGAAFITIDDLEFDLPEFVSDEGDDDDDDDDEEAIDLSRLPKKLQAFEAHNGELSALFIRWIHHGSVYLYVAEASWLSTASDLRDAWLAKGAVDRNDNLAARRARAEELAEQLERDEAFRRANARTRKSVGAQLIARLRKASDDSAVIDFAIGRAATNADTNSRIKYQEISERLADLARDLAATDAWKTAYQAPAKATVTREFLIAQSGGYAPTDALTKELRDAARNLAPVMRLGNRE